MGRGVDGVERGVEGSRESFFFSLSIFECCVKWLISPRSSCTSTIQNQTPHHSASCLSTYSPPPEEERNQNLCRKTLICLDIFHIASDETKKHRTFQAGGKMVGRRGKGGRGLSKTYACT